MQATKYAFDKLLRAYLQKLNPRIFGIATSASLTLEPLQGGLHNLNYCISFSDSPGKKFALRIYPDNKPGEDKIAREYESLQAISGGVAPKAVYLGKPDFIDSSVLIETFVDGAHKKLASLDGHEIEQFARAVKELHAVKKDAFTSEGGGELAQGNYEDYLRYNMDSSIYSRLQNVPNTFMSADRKLVDVALKRIDQMKERQAAAFSGDAFSMLHNDLGSSNILWHDDTLTILDWEDVSYGDPADEVAYIFAINNVDDYFKGAFLDAYMSRQDDAFIARVSVYFLKNKLFDFVWVLDQLYKATTDTTSLLKRPADQYKAFYATRLRSLGQALATSVHL